jgi:hypothetical protein
MQAQWSGPVLQAPDKRRRCVGMPEMNATRVPFGRRSRRPLCGCVRLRCMSISHSDLGHPVEQWSRVALTLGGAPRACESATPDVAPLRQPHVAPLRHASPGEGLRLRQRRGWAGRKSRHLQTVERAGRSCSGLTESVVMGIFMVWQAPRRSALRSRAAGRLCPAAEPPPSCARSSIG